MKHPIKLFMDSGAVTFANTRARWGGGAHMGAYMKDRGTRVSVLSEDQSESKENFSWVYDEEFIWYKEEYIEFLKKYGSILEAYCTIDIINNGQLTREVQLDLEARGLHPMPVYHLGEPIKYLRWYLDRKNNDGGPFYDYIGMGGMTPNSPNVLLSPLDQIWDELFTDDEGWPIIKVHGFAMTSHTLIRRYPWYSVDSTSWVKWGTYGVILVPNPLPYTETTVGEVIYDYTGRSTKVHVSIESPRTHDFDEKYDESREHRQAYFTKYFNHHGFSYGVNEKVRVPKSYKCYIPKRDDKSWKKEVYFADIPYSEDKYILRPKEEGFSNSYRARDEINARFYVMMEKQLPEWPWRLSLNITKGLFNISKAIKELES